MKIEVKLFAAMKQAAGADTVAVELPDGATVADLRQALAGRLPALAELSGHAVFAVNAEYAADNAIIPYNAEVAWIPPVSGG